MRHHLVDIVFWSTVALTFLGAIAFGLR